MTYEKFVNELMNRVEDKLGDGYTVERIKMQKNNGEQDAISIKASEAKIGRVVYTESLYDAYQGGTSLTMLASQLVNTCTADLPSTVSGFAADLVDYEKIKDKICFKLVNADMNADLRKGCPTIPFLDMLIMFYVAMDDSGTLITKVTNELAGDWGVTAEQLLETAGVNMPKRFPAVLKSMADQMLEILADSLGDIPADLRSAVMDQQEICRAWVLTNNTCINGASALLYPGMMSMAAERVGGDFVVIPSSVNETLLLGVDNAFGPDDMKEMIQKVNGDRNAIRREDVLSDHAYLYHSATKTFGTFE